MKNSVPAGALALLLSSVPSLRSNTFLEVAPGVVELSVVAGKTSKGQLAVRNSGDTEVLVDIEIRDGWAERTGLPSLPPDRWLELQVPHPFVLKPGASKKVNFTATPPADFSGEAMAMVVFGGPTSENRGGAGYRFRQGIPIYIIARETASTKLTLGAVLPYINSLGELEFYVDIKNEGNIHVRPTGALAVVKSGAAEAVSAPLASGMPVFPTKAQRYFARVQKQTFGPGAYRAELTVKDDGGQNVLASGALSFKIDAKNVVTVTKPFAEARP